MARRWTKRESQQLLMGAGAFGVAWLRGQTGSGHNWVGAPRTRSYYAVMARAQRMGLGGLTRGALSLREVMRQTGYSATQLVRAQEALNQKWKRTGPNGDYLITDDQLDEIVEWLKHDFWCKAKHLYSCVWCGSERRPHLLLGLCGRCHKRYWRMCLVLEVPSAVKDQRTLVAYLRGLSDTDLVERKFLGRAKWRLGRGLALERGQLEWLSLLIPGGWYANRNTGQ